MKRSVKRPCATVAYTVLVEPVLLALRRLAHEDVSSRLHYGDREA